MPVYYLPSISSDIWGTIESQGLETNQFDINEHKYDSYDLPFLRVTFKYNPNYYFMFRNTDRKTRVIFCPATPANPTLDFAFNDPSLNIPKVLIYVTNWIKALKKEMDSEIKNTFYQSPFHSFSGDTSFTDDYFSETEKAETIERVKLLKEQINKLNLLPEQMKTLEEKIDLMVEERFFGLKKSEWLMLFYTTLAAALVTASIDVERGNAFWSLVHVVFSVGFRLMQGIPN